MKSKECKECGRIFMPRCGTQRYCDEPHQTECKYCGRIFDYTCSPKEKPKYCSQHCINEGKKQTVRAKYGVDNVSELAEVRGKISRANSSEEVVARRRETSLKNWGVDNPAKSEEVKAKMSATMKGREYLEGRAQTCKEKYGYASPMQCEEVKAKREATCLERYGMKGHPWNPDTFMKIVTDPTKAEEYIKFKEDPQAYISDNYPEAPSIYQLTDDLGVSNTPIYDILVANNCRDLIQHNYSNMESEVMEFIRSIVPHIVIERNNRTIIKPQELDLYLPEYKLGIECNPASTHNSSIGDPWGSKPKHYKYHQDKSTLAQQNGVFLFHIFGYEWVNKKGIIKSMMANLLHVSSRKLNGRDTYVCEVSGNECKQFLNDNHRQGYTSSRVRLGLRLKSTDELVSVMTFSHMRNTMGKSSSADDDVWELSRFCSLLNTNVRGAGDKLFKAFLSRYNPQKVVSFSDIAHTTGKLYQKLGFNNVSSTPPSYVWSDIYDNVYYHRVSCQKHHLRKLLDDDSIDIDNNTEKEIMEAHKFVRIYDSGVVRWEYTK